MKKDKIYVKAFKLSNKENGKFTKEDFERFQEKLEIIRKLYFKPEVQKDCYDSFRTITKEVKRAAHNAGLDYKLLNFSYDSDEINATISGDTDTLNSITLLVFIRPVMEIKEDYFTIFQLRGCGKFMNLKDDSFVTVTYKTDVDAKGDLWDIYDSAYFYEDEYRPMPGGFRV